MIMKSQSPCELELDTTLESKFISKRCCFQYEESFDISVYDTEKLIVFFCGYISNLHSLSNLYSKKFETPSHAVATIYSEKATNLENVILGNFLFCVYEKQSGSLTLVRDHFGSRPLYYMNDDRFIAFSTNLRLLLDAKISKFSLNESSLKSYLGLIMPDPETTFYKEINRLPASSILTFKQDYLAIRTYNFLDPKTNESMSRKLDEFTFRFEEAVGNSIDQEKKIGLMLSGGLDSSAIALGLKNNGINSVRTFSANFTHLPSRSKKLSDETDFQRMVERETGYAHISIPTKDISPIQSIEKLLEIYDEPVHFPNIYIWDKVVSEAKSQGVEVMLTGQDGDNVVSHGHHRFFELIKKFNVFVFLYEVLMYSRFNNISFKRVFFYFSKQILLKLKFIKISKFNSTILIDSVFSEINQTLGKAKTAVDSHKDNLKSPLHTLTFEWRYLFFKNHDMEVRTPFYDLNLVNFCISLHSKWKLRHGRTRFILREYLKNKVPASLSARPRKANLSHGIFHNLSSDDLEKIRQEINKMHAYLTEIVDRQKLVDYLRKLEGAKKLDMGRRVETMAELDFIITSLIVFFVANRWLKKNNHLLAT